MNSRYILTTIELSEHKYQVLAVSQNGKLRELSCERLDKKSILGNIYIGRVKDIATNINAAFIEIGNGITCYYSLEDYKSPLFTKKIGKKPLCIGDEIVVQVTKEAVKTKFPTVTTNLSFAGKYLVLTTGNTTLGISNKLPKDVKKQLRELFTEKLKQTAEFGKVDGFGIVLRTNAAAAKEADILAEYHALYTVYHDLKETCIHKTAFSLLRQTEPFYLQELKGFTFDETDEIVTDDTVAYEILSENLLSEGKLPIRLYTDESYALSKLYSLETALKEAQQEKVWLKSGAYLIISPTEALTVIDVNSGKNTRGKNPQEHYLNINKEAAIEIARQLSLRNISGICIVDFINMEASEAMQELMQTFRQATKEDRVPVHIVDITKLGLVELTRKKVKASLREQLA